LFDSLNQVGAISAAVAVVVAFAVVFAFHVALKGHGFSRAAQRR
jgi:hypothetical protein